MAPPAGTTTIESSTRRNYPATQKVMNSNTRLWSLWTYLLLIILIINCIELNRHEVEANNIHRRFYRRAVRLCSRNLSDALYLLCKDRGYNEPFSSGETETVKHTTGPGLVEECCYNSCSIEQMEQYCKP